MRLDASIFGLVAWLGEAEALDSTPFDTSTRGTPTGTRIDPTNHAISFASAFDSEGSRVISPSEETHVLTWTYMKVGLDVKNATLFAIESNGHEWPVATSTPFPPPVVKNYIEGVLAPKGKADSETSDTKRDKHAPGLSFVAVSHGKRQQSRPANLPLARDSVTINPSLYNEGAFDKKLYLAVEWYKNSGGNGKSFTTPFAISTQAPGSQAWKNLTDDLDKYDASKPWRIESSVDGQGDDNNPLVFPVIVAPSSSPSTATLTSETSQTSGLNNNAGSPANQSASLSPGAIAGIVVGAVIGLLLIIALAYFLCIRRRAGGKKQRRHIHGDVGYASDSGAAAMMMREKDMSGVNHGSPQSAFADDGGRLHDRGAVGHGNDSTTYSSTPPYQEERGTAAGIGTHPQQSSDSLPQNDYSLYNSGNGNGDQGTATRRPQSYAADSAIGVAVTGGASSGANAERERNGSVGGGTVGRTSYQTSRPGSEVRSPSRYAHLIEEGMTEDEIRRLEDEERQLDAAIEDAGRHGRPK